MGGGLQNISIIDTVSAGNKGLSSGHSSKIFRGGQEGNNAPERLNRITLGNQRVAIILHKNTYMHMQSHFDVYLNVAIEVLKKT